MTSSALLPRFLAAVAAGVFVGSGLAALAHAPPNDPCGDFGALPEGSTSSNSLELWPRGPRCQYYVGSHVTRSTFFGASAAELYVWIVAAACVAAIALLKRDQAAARGAAAMAMILALAGAGWQLAGIEFAIPGAVLVGLPLAFALDYLLRSRATRSIGASLRVVIALAAITFCAIFLVLFEPSVGIVVGLLAGALASVRRTGARQPPVAC